MVDDPRTLKSFWNNLAPHKRRNILSSYIQYQVEQGERGPSVKEVPNDLYGVELTQDLEDVLYGICNLDWDNKKGVSLQSLYSVISELPVLSRIQIQNHLCVGERQARRYMKAVNLVFLFLDSKPGPYIKYKEVGDEEIGMEDFENPYD